MNRRLFFVAVLLALVTTPGYAFLSGWGYRQAINVSSGSNVTDYALPVNVTYTANMEADFGDVRFTDLNDFVYDYWISHKGDGVFAYFYVEGNFTTVNGTQMYMYYGKTGQATTSNGTNTFQMFDDFLGSSLGGDWTEATGSVVVSGGTVKLDGSDDIKHSATWGLNYAFGIRTKADEQDNIFFALGEAGDPAVSTDPGLSVLNSDGQDDGNFSFLGFRTLDSGIETTYLPTPDIRNYFTMEIQRASASLTNFWVDFKSLFNATTLITSASNLGFKIGEYGQASTTTVDWVYVRKYISPDPTYVFGAEASSPRVDFTFVPSVPHVDERVTFTATWVDGNYTNFWWNFTEFNTTYYTVNTEINFTGFNVSANYSVVLVAFNVDSATNDTRIKTVMVYDNLTGVIVEPNLFLPFLFVAPTTNFSYTLTGGIPTVNSSWTVIRPDETTQSFVNQSPLEYTPTQTDIHFVSVTVCDLGNGLCVTNSTQFKPWNVTGGIHLHTPFNKTSNSLSEVFYGDSASFEAPGELTWGLNGMVKVGTTATWTFNTANAFWSDDNYLHHKVTVNNSWGVYVSNQSFTVVTALYNLSVGCTDFRVPYCFINADIYDLSTSPATQITDSGNTFDYFLTLLSGEGHDNETNDLQTSASLNLSLCLNATPLIDSFTLDGIIGYSATNYTSTSYAFDSAEMDFVTSCSFDNGHKFNFYLLPNSTKTYATTFTFLQGGTPLEDALVKIQATLGSNWITISSGVTDVNGKVTFPLEQCFTWYKIIVENSGEVLYQSEVTCLAATECTTTTCSRIIPIDTVPQEWFSVMDGIASNCVYSEVLNYLRCTVTDTSGMGVSATLTVARLLGGDVVCTESETSTTTTLICETGGFYPGAYKYLVEVNTDDTTYPIQSGSFTIGTPTTMGEEGPIVALAILLTLVFAVSKTHPVILVIVSGFAFVLISTLKLITFGYATTGWIIAMAGVALVRAMTKGA